MSINDNGKEIIKKEKKSFSRDLGDKALVGFVSQTATWPLEYTKFLRQIPLYDYAKERNVMTALKHDIQTSGFKNMFRSSIPQSLSAIPRAVLRFSVYEALNGGKIGEAGGETNKLKQDNISVITIEPGPIESNFRDRTVDTSLNVINTEASHFKKHYQVMVNEFKQKKANSMFTQKPDAVVKKFIHAIESSRPKAKYPVTLPAHFLIFMRRILPTKLLDKLLIRISRHEINPDS